MFGRPRVSSWYIQDRYSNHMDSGQAGMTDDGRHMGLPLRFTQLKLECIFEIASQNRPVLQPQNRLYYQ